MSRVYNFSAGPAVLPEELPPLPPLSRGTEMISGMFFVSFESLIPSSATAISSAESPLSISFCTSARQLSYLPLSTAESIFSFT